MPQIFDRSSNALARMSLILTGLIVIALGVTLDQLQRSPWVTRQGQRADQPVPFSHKHHVTGLGIQCQYCHTTVERSSYAGIPPTKTCMNCHAQIWTNAQLLEPVRQSWATGESLRWIRVHDLPDYVYFNHSIHVNKGIGCSSCHGRVDLMPIMYQENSLQMEWCLNCHRDPAKIVPSLAKNLAVWRKTFSDEVPSGGFGMLELQAAGLKRVAEFRADLEFKDRFADAHYLDVQKDPIGEVQRLYRQFGVDLSTPRAAALRRWLADNREGHSKGPRHTYSLDQFDLDLAKIDTVMGDYIHSCGVQLER